MYKIFWHGICVCRNRNSGEAELKCFLACKLSVQSVEGLVIREMSFKKYALIASELQDLKDFGSSDARHRFRASVSMPSSCQYQPNAHFTQRYSLQCSETKLQQIFHDNTNWSEKILRISTQVLPRTWPLTGPKNNPEESSYLAIRGSNCCPCLSYNLNSFQYDLLLS